LETNCPINTCTSCHQSLATRITHLTAAFTQLLPPPSDVSIWELALSCWNESTITVDKLNYNSKAMQATAGAAGRATLAGQCLSAVPGKDRHPGPPGWGVGRAASSPVNCLETAATGKP